MPGSHSSTPGSVEHVPNYLRERQNDSRTTPSRAPSDGMTLGDKQRLFVQLLPQLIDYIYAQGLSATLGDAYRDPRLHGEVGTQQGYGKAYSLHKSRLAIDLNLFDWDGKYIRDSDHPAWEMVGSYWEGLHELCANGRKWRDANHFSMHHDGRM